MSMEAGPPEDEQYYKHAFDATRAHNRAYLEHCGEQAAEDAEQVLQQGPLADTIVLIPVAAHQEQAAIYPALHEYARQDTDRPFSVVLGMNHPVGADVAAVHASMDQVQAARRDFPQLDVRIFEAVYDDAPIGAIRGELWATTLLAAEMGGTVHEHADAIAFNHDIDTVRVPRGYVRRVQEQFNHDVSSSRRRLSQSISDYNGNVPIMYPYSGAIKHARSVRHPNASLAVLWADAKNRINDSYFEAGVIMSLGYYASKGGFDFTRVSGEVIELLDRGHQDDPRPILSPALETSPRRFVERLCRDGGGIADVWKDGNFSSTEEYRAHELTYPDISTERLIEVTEPDIEDIARLITGGAHSAALNALRRAPVVLDEERLDVYYQLYDAQVRRRTRLAHAVLHRMIGHPRDIDLELTTFLDSE